jgi:dephospho-CoA kinase
MFLVGLTGGIGSGKSTVSQMMSEMGVHLIDADMIARQVVKPGMKAWVQIRDNFGSQVIQQNGEIDRQKLAQIIFNNEEKRLLLNRITHPQIYKEIYKQLFINLLFGKQFVVLDLPLLYETDVMTKWFHKIIVVNCSRDQQIERLFARNNYSFEESVSRIESQMPLEKKCRMSDFVINNSNDLNQTKEEVKQIVNELKCSYFQWKIRIPFYLISLTAIYLIAYSIKKVLHFSNII